MTGSEAPVLSGVEVTEIPGTVEARVEERRAERVQSVTPNLLLLMW